MPSRKYLILLPVFNEEESIVSLLYKISMEAQKLNWAYEIVVCNDGSSDNSLSIIKRIQEKLPLHVIEHSINRGLGETSRDLFEYAAANTQDDDIIIRMDCDDTHKPEYFKALTNRLENDADVVIASRFENGGGQNGVSFYLAFINRCANISMKVVFPIPNLKEYTCGYRAYRSDIIRQAVTLFQNEFIQLKRQGFTCTLEKLVKLNIIGARFAEVPFILRYDQKRSSSKMVTSATTLGYFVLTLLHYWPRGGWRNRYKGKVHQK